MNNAILVFKCRSNTAQTRNWPVLRNIPIRFLYGGFWISCYKFLGPLVLSLVARLWTIYHYRRWPDGCSLTSRAMIPPHPDATRRQLYPAYDGCLAKVWQLLVRMWYCIEDAISHPMLSPTIDHCLCFWPWHQPSRATNRLQMVVTACFSLRPRLEDDISFQILGFLPDKRDAQIPMNSLSLPCSLKFISK